MHASAKISKCTHTHVCTCVRMHVYLLLTVGCSCYIFFERFDLLNHLSIFLAIYENRVDFAFFFYYLFFFFLLFFNLNYDTAERNFYFTSRFFSKRIFFNSLTHQHCKSAKKWGVSMRFSDICLSRRWGWGQKFPGFIQYLLVV